MSRARRARRPRGNEGDPVTFLSAARRAAGISTTAMAEVLSMHQTTISQLERGLRSTLTPEQNAILEHIFQTNSEALLATL